MTSDGEPTPPAADHDEPAATAPQREVAVEVRTPAPPPTADHTVTRSTRLTDVRRRLERGDVGQDPAALADALIDAWVGRRDE